MLIANALVKSGLEIESHVHNVISSVPLDDRQKSVIDILNLFNSNKRGGMSPFSIQNVAEIALKDYSVYPGQWYGINTASLIFESLEQRYRPIKRFRICTFQDGNISL